MPDKKDSSDDVTVRRHLKVIKGRDYLPPGFPYDDDPDDSPEAVARRRAMTPESLKQKWAKEDKEGRTVKVYDNTGMPKGGPRLIYHRTSDGITKVFDSAAITRFASGGGNRTISGSFRHTTWQGAERSSTPFKTEYPSPVISLSLFKP